MDINYIKKHSSTASVQQIRQRTIISFILLFLFFAFCVFSWWKIKSAPDVMGVQKPLRAMLDRNEAIFGSIFSVEHKAKTYTRSEAAGRVRVNGDAGLKSAFDPATWHLVVLNAKGDSIKINLDDLKRLPKTEVVFNFKCIEGWSQITYWGGVRFSDFAKAYGLNTETMMGYVGLNTPDKEYYVGIDMASMLQPQTLLCYEMNGQPLPMNQGYPLRLIIPVKYGIKHLKRIGTLFFSNDRPPDYWAERGYDYYSGL